MKKSVCLLLCLTLLVGVTACGGAGRVANDDQSLEIYVANLGYGTDWLQPLVDAFKEEDWVKEKYPNFNVPRISSNSERKYAADRVMAGPVNTIDLFFGVEGIKSFLDQNYSGTTKYFEKLDEDVYDQNVPGENVTFREKMLDDFVDMTQFETTAGEKELYAVPWVAGGSCMIYNKTVFDECGFSVPRTTDELIELCNTIIETDDTKNTGKLKPFVFSSEDNGWMNYVIPYWWAQYEGVENYRLYYEGLVPGAIEGDYSYSMDVLKQKGKQYTLELVEQLIGSEGGRQNKYVYDDVTLNFTQAQTQFMLRRGLMIPGGSWFDLEMHNISSKGIDDVFTMMKMPIISKITEKTPSITTDAKLREVVDAIDAGKSYTEVDGVTEADYKIVTEARNVLNPIATHTAYIPSYSTAKGLAKDFLRFLGTDKANRVFAEATYGVLMPFEYDLEADDPDFYAENVTQMQKDWLDLLARGEVLATYDHCRLNYMGNFHQFSGLGSGNNVTEKFTAVSNERMTAQQIMQAEIDYWAGQQHWETALFNAGIKSDFYA